MHARRVVVARRSRGLVPRCVARHEQPVSGGEAAPLAALQECLQDDRWHDADARVMVSNAQVRYCIVPHSPHLRGVADESALAMHKFQQVHGAQAATMAVRLSNPLAGIDQLAAAIDENLIAEVKQLLAGARLRLRFFEPMLMRGFNLARRQIRDPDFWFAQAEPDLLLLARLQGGNWLSVAAMPRPEPLGLALPAMLREARLMAGGRDFPRRLYLQAIGVDGTDCLRGTDVELVDLSQSPPRRFAFFGAASGHALEC
jgi:hypothetical protein